MAIAGLQDSRLQLGLVLGRKYQLLTELGSGGFGRVYLARHLSLGSSVAIKVGRSWSRNEALLNEARVAARLASPYSVRVYDVGACPSGAPYIVMEHLNGQPLQEYLMHVGPVPTEQALSWCLNVCEALAEAHGEGLVHCDIKPSNLFLVNTPAGEQIVRLTDFGLAKRLCDQPDTCSGASELAGTPAYMSPERLRSGVATVASDVWSLGIVLFEMLTGTRPFIGRTPQELIAAITLDSAPNATSVMPQLPAVLDVIIGRCLRKHAEERYTSVQEVARALELVLSDIQSTRVNWVTEHKRTKVDALATESLTLKFAVPPRSSRFVWLGAGAMVIALGVFGLWRLRTVTAGSAVTEAPQRSHSNMPEPNNDEPVDTRVERGGDLVSMGEVYSQQAEMPMSPPGSTLLEMARPSSERVTQLKSESFSASHKRSSSRTSTDSVFDQKRRGGNVAPDFILEPDF